MPRSKPAGWPKLMVTKRLAGGAVGYYWTPPTWAIKAGFRPSSEPLGVDYAEAKRRCDIVLNPLYDAWRTRGVAADIPARASLGSFDWMVATYKTSPKYTNRPPRVRKSYDSVLNLISGYTLKDGRKLGTLPLTSIQPGTADRLFEKIKIRADGTERVRTAILATRVAARAWNVARRDRPDMVPDVNPFAKMGLTYDPVPTKPVGYDELMRFVAACDEHGEPSLGTAAMIAFFWLQREEDICTRLSWGHYRPADAQDFVKIFHHKTGELVDLPLHDVDGTPLWPDLTARLDVAERSGTLIVMRDRPQRRRDVILPWKLDYFRKRVAAIRRAAGIDPDIKFMGLRHGGNTEAADAGLTDAQIRALSGHKTEAMVKLYAKPTADQRRAGARKRLDQRTKKGGLSE